MPSHSCLCTPPIFFSMPEPIWKLYVRISCNWAHLNGLIYKSFPSVCVSVYGFPLSLRGNGLVFTFPRKRIHGTKKVVRLVHMRPMSHNRKVCGPVCVPLPFRNSVSANTFPRQWRIVRGFVFYAVHFVWKESRLWVLPRTSCLLNIFINETQTEKKFNSACLS
jgi:hypothetical protein